MSAKKLVSQVSQDGKPLILANESYLPVNIPSGHIGPVELPGTGRMVWWTGRVAIGLRHQPTHHFGPVTQSALWVQSLMLHKGSGGFASA